MRIILLMALVFPCFLHAQINRSAKELARETTREYLTNKVFRNDSYKPVSYGELKPWKDNRSDITWTFAHTFEITHRNNSGFYRETNSQQTYQFLFYLDKQMKILKAESYSK